MSKHPAQQNIDILRDKHEVRQRWDGRIGAAIGLLESVPFEQRDDNINMSIALTNLVIAEALRDLVDLLHPLPDDLLLYWAQEGINHEVKK